MTTCEKTLGAAGIATLVILMVDRKRLLNEAARKEARIYKMVDDYHDGSITLSKALNGLKAVLHGLSEGSDE